MKKLNKFIKDYNYELSDTLIYNSYSVEGLRDSYRPGESISISEILSLIVDPTIEFVKIYYEDKMKEAQIYGTKTHGELEGHIKYKDLLNPKHPLHVQYELGCIKEDIEPLLSEQMYSLDIEGLPIITGTIDLIALQDGVSSIIDFKTTKNERNFKTIKHKLQILFYMKLGGLNNGGLFYLNNKKYKLVMLSEQDIELYMPVVNELIEYTQYLFSKGQIINLVDK